jgi:MoaA/NifB/PqqE/SkfB family radical SAM enzyme
MKQLILSNHLNYKFVSRIIRWHINYYFLDRGRPINAGTYITDACNARCVMCNVWKKKKPSTYPRIYQERAIDALSHAGCFYYSIGGGEPTTVKDLPDRLTYAARKLPYVRLTTNGLAMTRELARALNDSGIKEIGLSIDGTDEYHNLVRGRPDAAEKVWNSLELLCSHAPKVQIIINSVLTPYNLEGLREIGKRLSKFPGVLQKYLPVTFHELFGTQDLKSLPLHLEAAPQKEMESFLDQAILNSRITNSSIFLEKAKLFFRGEPNVIPEQKRCLYSYHAMEFDPAGFAYPCRTGMNFTNGVLPEKDLSEYFKTAEYRATQKRLESCTKCQGTMMLCYYEPRLNFPLSHLLYYKFKH